MIKLAQLLVLVFLHVMMKLVKFLSQVFQGPSKRLETIKKLKGQGFIVVCF